MKDKYLPPTTTGKPLISKAPPPYRPPAKWPWLLTVGSNHGLIKTLFTPLLLIFTLLLPAFVHAQSGGVLAGGGNPGHLQLANAENPQYTPDMSQEAQGTTRNRNTRDWGVGDPTKPFTLGNKGQDSWIDDERNPSLSSKTEGQEFFAYVLGKYDHTSALVKAKTVVQSGKNAFTFTVIQGQIDNDGESIIDFMTELTPPDNFGGKVAIRTNSQTTPEKNTQDFDNIYWGPEKTGDSLFRGVSVRNDPGDKNQDGKEETQYLLQFLPSHLLYSPEDYTWDATRLKLVENGKEELAKADNQLIKRVIKRDEVEQSNYSDVCDFPSGECTLGQMFKKVNNSSKVAAAQRIPILFIHGWQGDLPNAFEILHEYKWSTSGDLESRPVSGENYWRNLLTYMYRHHNHEFAKYKPYIYHYPSYKHVKFNARMLKEMLDELKANDEVLRNAIDAGKLIIIAHSMGTLVSRSLMEEFGYLDHVERFISLAGVHHGSPGAIGSLVDTSYVADKNLNTPGACDLMSDNYDGFIDTSVKYDIQKDAAGELLEQRADSGSVFINKETDGLLYYGYDLSKPSFDSFYLRKLAVTTSRDLYVRKDMEVPIFPNPWLSNLNKNHATLYQGKTKNKYYFYAGFVITTKPDPLANDLVLDKLAAGAVGDNGYEYTDAVVPVSSGILDTSRGRVLLEDGTLNTYANTNGQTGFYNASQAKPDELTFKVNQQSFSFKDTFTKGFLTTGKNNWVANYRVFADYNHDRLLNGGYTDALLENGYTDIKSYRTGGGTAGSAHQQFDQYLKSVTGEETAANTPHFANDPLFVQIERDLCNELNHSIDTTTDPLKGKFPTLEKADLLYDFLDGSYHLKVNLRMPPDGVFSNVATQNSPIKPSSCNPLEVTLSNDRPSSAKEHRVANVTEVDELLSFDVMFDDITYANSVLNQSGEVAKLSVSYHMANSSILPDGEAEAVDAGLPIQYSDLKWPVPYLEIRTPGDKPSFLTQGETVVLCPKNQIVDFKKWTEIGLNYRIESPTPSQGRLTGTLDGDCLKFVAKETGQYAFLNMFSMVNGQPEFSEVLGVTVPIAADLRITAISLSGLIKKEVTEGAATTTATTGQTPAIDSNAQSFPGRFKQVSSGREHTCALKEDGSIVCWGNNDYGQAMPPAGTFTQVSSSGDNHTCALKANGSLVCWGNDGNDRATPPVGSFTQVSSGEAHTCALKTDGSLACWGYNEAMPPAGSFMQVSSGGLYTCALKTDSSLACWGSNQYGQATPPAAGGFTQISSGYNHVCALKTDGSLACWGNNEYGKATPPAGSFRQVSSGGLHTCALKTDGSLACWGDNYYGEATPPAGTFTQVSSGAYHTCALKTDGSLVCWGRNDYGQATPLSATSISNNTTSQPTILSVSPTTAMLDTPTIFTLTGNNLVTGMGFTVADCEQTITDGFSNELAGGTDTQRQFQCIPRGTAGLKTGLVKNKPGGTVLHTFTVEVDGTSATAPQITSVTPTNAVIGATVTFTVTGTHLYEGMGFTVGDCVHSNIEVAGGTDTQRQFVCTQQGMNGNQRGLVKDFPGGNLLYRFNVETTGGAEPPPVPEITPEPVAPPPAPPIIIYPPTCAADSATLDTTCHGNYQTLTGDHKVEKWANISNLVITGTVENEGWISNTTIQAGATIKGGVLTGYITNEGTLIDIEFVGALLKGGTLAGKIVNNSRVGGKIQEVKLAAGTKITGGILAGPIEGDCQQPALLENVKVKTGSVLKCVTLGKNVKMEKGVTVEEK